MLNDLESSAGSEAAAREAHALVRELFPLCRSITGDGVRATLDRIAAVVPLDRSEVPTGTPAFDWEVPREWNVREAWIADADGRRVVDFREHTLHLVSYSIPFEGCLTRVELEPHLHSLPERPDWIPYRTTYYREDWGFCLRHRDRAALGDGPFYVKVDTDLRPGNLSYAECVIPGSTDGEGLIYTHVCHPSLANDNLTGIAAATVLARALGREAPRLTWRIVFGPGTIGSLVWLARNEHVLARIRAGLVIGLLGDSGPLTYKRSRRGSAPIDRIADLVLSAAGTGSRIVDFEPYGYDERQFCSPGINLPVGRLTRSSNGMYPEYHTSADDVDFVKPAQLAGSLRALARMVRLADGNRVLLNLHPKGEPRLGKRGLFRATGGTSPAEFEYALLWVLNMSDGTNDLLQVAARSGLPFERIDEAAVALERVGLVRTLSSSEEEGE